MARTVANGVEIEFEVLGPEAAEAMLLIMGFGAQLTRWPEAFCERLVGAGYRVIRFDNRDVGLSEKLHGVPLLEGPELAARRRAGLSLHGAYTLEDMADDAADLLRALGVARAHVVGVSMGAMIGQLMAANHAARVLSLTSIMSPSASPAIPLGNPAFEANPGAPPAPGDLAAMVEHQLPIYEALAGPAYRRPREPLRLSLMRDLERAFDPSGIVRQGKAIGACHDRRGALARIRAPTLVVQGLADPLVPAAAALDIARRISGAELRTFQDMGHDLPEPLLSQIAEAILALAARATRHAPTPSPFHDIEGE